MYDGTCGSKMQEPRLENPKKVTKLLQELCSPGDTSNAVSVRLSGLLQPPSTCAVRSSTVPRSGEVSAAAGSRERQFYSYQSIDAIDTIRTPQMGKPAMHMNNIAAIRHIASPAPAQLRLIFFPHPPHSHLVPLLAFSCFRHHAALAAGPDGPRQRASLQGGRWFSALHPVPGTSWTPRLPRATQLWTAQPGANARSCCECFQGV